MPTSLGPTPLSLLVFAEGLVEVGFPRDVQQAVDAVVSFAAGDLEVVDQALELARERSRQRRSKLLVVELLIQSQTEIAVVDLIADPIVVGIGELAGVGAD